MIEKFRRITPRLPQHYLKHILFSQRLSINVSFCLSALRNASFPFIFFPELLRLQKSGAYINLSNRHFDFGTLRVLTKLYFRNISAFWHWFELLLTLVYDGNVKIVFPILKKNRILPIHKILNKNDYVSSY